MLVCKAVQSVFFIYSSMVLIRCIGSWLPELSQYKWMQFLRFYTDPYLNFFRSFIPPIGGTLDLSPIVAILALRFLENFLIKLVCF